MRRGCFVAVLAAALTITTEAAHAGGHVYLLRGLVNVFSQGMDTMAAKLRARGISASVHGHAEFMGLASQAAALAKSGKGPIVIVGHSYGADSTVYMANQMAALGAPVGLIVMYGPTSHHAIPSNVRQVLNYYQANGTLWRGVAYKGPGFHGSINNVDLDKQTDITHFNIEKIDRLHSQAIARIAGLTGSGRPLRSETASAAPITPDSTANTPADTATTPAAAPAAKPARRASSANATANTTTTTPRRASSKRSASSNRTPVDTLRQHGAF